MKFDRDIVVWTVRALCAIAAVKLFNFWCVAVDELAEHLAADCRDLECPCQEKRRR